MLRCAGVGSLGTLAGTGFKRPLELATMRLRNMVEMLGNWRTYVPRDDSLLYSHRDRGLPGFSATMTRPLAFLDPYLGTGD